MLQVLIAAPDPPLAAGLGKRAQTATGFLLRRCRGMDVYEEEGNLFFNDFTQFAAKDRLKAFDRKFQLLISFPQVLTRDHVNVSGMLRHEHVVSMQSDHTRQDSGEHSVQKQQCAGMRPVHAVGSRRSCRFAGAGDAAFGLPDHGGP